jgi:hypothetical protein
MMIIDCIKNRLHRDLASNPVAHGWVLNLYLNGERYPQQVCDYFQSEYAPSAELAAELNRHRRDEYKHELLYAKALRMLAQPVLQLPRHDIFNEVIRSFTPGTFHIVAADPIETRREKLANFLAHAHFLEKRVARSLCYHVDACNDAKSYGVAELVSNVLRDEARHLCYTRQSVFDLLPRRRAWEVLAVHQRAEARANLSFSQAELRTFVRRFGGVLPRTRRLLYRFCACLMEGAARYV